MILLNPKTPKPQNPKTPSFELNKNKMQNDQEVLELEEEEEEKKEEQKESFHGS